MQKEKIGVLGQSTTVGSNVSVSTSFSSGAGRVGGDTWRMKSPVPLEK